MIFVFKTSIKNKRDIKNLKPHFDKILPKAKWNFDLEDCDNILRIDSEEDIVLSIKDLLEKHNYHCIELS